MCIFCFSFEIYSMSNLNLMHKKFDVKNLTLNENTECKIIFVFGKEADNLEENKVKVWEG